MSKQEFSLFNEILIDWMSGWMVRNIISRETNPNCEIESRTKKNEKINLKSKRWQGIIGKLGLTTLLERKIRCDLITMIKTSGIYGNPTAASFTCNIYTLQYYWNPFVKTIKVFI